MRIRILLQNKRNFKIAFVKMHRELLFQQIALLKSTIVVIFQSELSSVESFFFSSTSSILYVDHLLLPFAKKNLISTLNIYFALECSNCKSFLDQFQWQSIINKKCRHINFQKRPHSARA